MDSFFYSTLDDNFDTYYTQFEPFAYTGMKPDNSEQQYPIRFDNESYLLDPMNTDDLLSFRNQTRNESVAPSRIEDFQHFDFTNESDDDEDNNYFDTVKQPFAEADETFVYTETANSNNISTPEQNQTTDVANVLSPEEDMGADETDAIENDDLEDTLYTPSPSSSVGSRSPMANFTVSSPVSSSLKSTKFASVNNVSSLPSTSPSQTARISEPRHSYRTGKPRANSVSNVCSLCQKSFGRSYDLVRHLNTIHNENKVKFQCEYCSQEKLFSRLDALTRHLRVKHDR